MTENIMICGVGGQGTLLASRIIGTAATSLGFDVKVSEVHGMSQRGGSVVTYVRYSDEGTVASPVICKGEADILISFELLESARWLPYLKKGGKLITSTQRINPTPVIAGAAVYPDNILEKLEEAGIDTAVCDATGTARSAGSEKAANVVLIGLLARFIGLGREALEKAVHDCVPEKFIELNLEAFEAGYNYRKDGNL